jgi:hypothetical protein
METNPTRSLLVCGYAAVALRKSTIAIRYVAIASVPTHFGSGNNRRD